MLTTNINYVNITFVGCSNTLHHKFPVFYGGVAKWLNAADCKSAPSGFGGSNPSPSTIMAIVAKWLTHLIVVQAFVGSIPISRPISSNNWAA